MRTLWKYKHFVPNPIEVQGTAWPDHDNEGDQIFDNTHFADREACWDCIERNARAGVILSGENVRYEREQLATAEKTAANEAAYFAAVTKTRRHEKPPHDQHSRVLLQA